MEELLRKLVEFPTVTSDHQANHEAIDYIASFVAQRGMHIERFVSNGHESLVATPVAGHKTPKVMLGGHIDVVPAAPDQFVLKRENGRYYGRGVMDMKFALAGYLYLIDQLRDTLASYDFGLMVTSDEEAGGFDGVAKLIEAGYIPKVCLLPDGGENWQIQTSSNGFLSCKLIARSKAAHGSRPWLTQNPIDTLLAALRDLAALFPPNPRPGMNTLSITNFHAGDGALTQIPDLAEAILDVRTNSEVESKQLQSAFNKICQVHDVELEYIVRGAATHFKLADPLIAPYAQLIQKYTGIEVTGSHAVASSDARHFVPHGVACISFYPTGSDLHGPQEWIAEESLEQFIHITREYLELIAKTPERNT